MTDQPIVQVEAARTFTRDLRNLAKKYRSIYQDIQPIIEEIQKGNSVGDQIPDIGYPVFKVRVRNTDIQKGKSGGYRLIYYLKTTTSILLLTLYTKSDQDDVTASDLRSIIENIEITDD